MNKQMVMLALVGAGVVMGSAQAAVPAEINLGVMGGENSTDQIGHNKCVADYLGKALNTKVNIRNASNYDAVIQGLLGKKIDMVLNMSPASFAKVYLKDPKAAELVGITVDDTDKSRGYHSVAFVRADSSFKSLDDLKGHTFAFADPDSTSGFRVPSHAFSKLYGGNMDNQFAGHFKSVVFSGGHEQDVLGVVNKQFDGAVTWTSLVGDASKGYTAGAFTKLVNGGEKDLMSKIRIIWQSEMIPNGPAIVSGYLDGAFKQKLADAIFQLDKDDHACFMQASGGTLHLDKTSIDEYKPVIDLVKAQSKEQR